MTSTRLIAYAAAALVSLGGGAAHAQDYPARPVSIVVPSTPGGGFDLIGRVMGEGLSRQLGGKSFVVENKTGSGTLVGTQYAAEAAPDGYTLMVGGLSNLVFNVGLYKSIKYDRTDFTTIAMVGTNPYLLVARPDLPVNSYEQLLQQIKAHPEKFTIGTAGSGSGQHIMAAAFVKAVDPRITIVPYRGAQAAYQDLLGNRIDLFIDAWPTVRPLLESKRVKALFTTASKRLPGAPDVPTVAESGLPMLEVVSWYTLSAPAKTPAATVATLRKAADEALKDPAVTSRLEKAGVDVTPMTPEAAERFMKADYDKWTGFIRQAGIVAE
ncbi:Tripartite tricarboxylate transporter family receptor [Pigmentiphaga humi]|uniref:Tripartite tricarboxylate transporter family receptor n=1 Tax=Pigmentiphaga humi TaxID=2478468 RepID=A0A3P4AZN0_9BURK|nr:tripartite tricarboxylate transporter substrate binding protein [Pigmentiphaga humi]VCU69031.1 Tripartite tricarboxylate transporter family receptor [Pigmentiphaga humi]